MNAHPPSSGDELAPGTNFGDDIDIFSNIHTHAFHVAIRHLHARAHITSVGADIAKHPEIYFQNGLFKYPYTHFPSGNLSCACIDENIDVRHRSAYINKSAYSLIYIYIHIRHLAV